MQLLKSRTVPHELRVLRSLNARMELSTEETKYYLHQEKGYQGEVIFDQLTEKLENDLFVINDLLLEVNNTTFQIDTLIIAQKTIYPIEIKNHEGDYFYEPGVFRTVSKNEIRNPLDQLKRTSSLLRQLLQTLRVQLPIEGYVTFVNPKFFLYQAPLNEPIIFPTQLDRFLKKLDQTPSKLNATHKKLADQLISLHIKEPRITHLPTYTYGRLKKGMLCSFCHCFMEADGQNKVVCPACGHEEDNVSAVLRSINELKLLFPNKKITTNSVFEWCGIIGSKRQIRRILKENYQLTGFGKWSYYE